MPFCEQEVRTHQHVEQVFELAKVAATGDLRPLHDPNAIDPVELLWVN